MEYFDILDALITIEEWKKLIWNSELLWDNPNYNGVIDGKHIQIRCPKSVVWILFTQKGYRMVLLATVDNG